MKKNKISAITLTLFAILSGYCLADGKENVAPEAIPPVTKPSDPENQLSAKDQFRILNAKKSDLIVKEIRKDKSPLSSAEKRTRERIQKEKFDANPRQNIPLKDCIKPNNVIDDDVQECVNGRKKKTW